MICPDTDAANLKSGKLAASKLKRVTASTSPKYKFYFRLVACLLYHEIHCSFRNLCYKEYLKDNDPLTPADFEIYWSSLDKNEQKVRVLFYFELQTAANRRLEYEALDNAE